MQNFVNGGTATANIMSWPGNGNVAIGELPFIAPFVDVNADGIYNYADGDYPSFILNGSTPSGCQGFLKGDKTVWWVFNDIGNSHTETFSNNPIGLEIRAQAFAYSAAGTHINNTTFYEYEIINRSNENLFDAYFGMWTDADLGNAVDDYVGCNVGLGLGYCYNGDVDDEGGDGYGLNPPAVGIDIFHGPLADANDGIDNNRNGVTDEPDEDIIMSKFVYYTSGNGLPNANPATLDDYYQYLSGIWQDGSALTYGANGLNQSNPPCSFMFPDLTDPLHTTSWTMGSAGIGPDDMRFLQSAGTFTLAPGEVNYISTGVVWAKAASGGPGASVNLLFIADTLAQHLFDNCFTVGLTENLQPDEYKIFPMPCTDISTLTFNYEEGRQYKMQLFSLNGQLSKEITGIKKNTIEIDRSGLKTGIYILRISDDKGIRCNGKLTVL